MVSRRFGKRRPVEAWFEREVVGGHSMPTMHRCFRGVKEVLCLVPLVWILASDSIIIRLNRYLPLANNDGEIVLLGAGLPQLLVGFSLWAVCVRVLLQPAARAADYWMGMFLCLWLAWLSWAGCLWFGDDISRAIILSASILLGKYLADLFSHGGRRAVYFICGALLLSTLSGILDQPWAGYLGWERVARWRGPFVNANTFAAVMGVGFIWACCRLKRAFKGGAWWRYGLRKSWTLELGVLVLSATGTLVSVFQSQSRTAVWSLAACLIGTLFALSTRFRRPTRAGLLGAGVLVVLVLMSNSSSGRLGRLPDWGDLSTVHRLRCSLVAIKAGAQAAASGHGWGFLHDLRKNSRELPEDPRAIFLNNFTHTFVARGAGGAIGLFVIFAALLKHLRRPWLGGTFAISVLIFTTFFFIQSVVNGMFFSYAVGPLFWALFFYVRRIGSRVRAKEVI